MLQRRCAEPGARRATQQEAVADLERHRQLAVQGGSEVAVVLVARGRLKTSTI